MATVKGLALNLCSWYSVLAPVGLIFYTEKAKTIVAVWVAVLLLTYLLPPTGIKKPHRHSEDPSNR